jgi:hypothetical protein
LKRDEKKVLFIHTTLFENNELNCLSSDISLIVDFEATGILMSEIFQSRFDNLDTRLIMFKSSLTQTREINLISDKWINNIRNAYKRADTNGNYKFENDHEIDTIDIDQIIYYWNKDNNFTNIVDDDELLYLKNLKSSMKITRLDSFSRIKIVATENAIQETELLSKIENLYKIKIEEREAPLFSPSDIIVGHRDCILLCNPFSKHRDLEQYMRTTMNRLILLSYQFDYCWIIIQSYVNNDQSEIFHKVFANITKFSSFILSMSRSLSLHVEIRYCCNISETVETIRWICGQQLQANVSSEEQVWIPEIETKNEQFISNFPSISLFGCHTLLNRIPSLKSLCSLTLEDLKNQFAFLIGSSRLDHFFKILNGNVISDETNTNIDNSIDLDQSALQ